MMTALVDGVPLDAAPGLSGVCPGCSGQMIPRCGQIKIWHWAHKVADCDAWSEPESEWHRSWKLHVPIAQREVFMERGGVKHRADVVVRGKVLELQASAISVAEIAEREAFYGDMAWLFRVTWHDRIHHGKYGFWWKRGAPSQVAITKPLFWDLGNEIVQVNLSFATKAYQIVVDASDEREGTMLDAWSKQVWTSSSTGRILGKIVRRWNTATFVRLALGEAP